MATAKVKPGDMTGRARETLAEQAKEELAKREGEISLARQAEKERLETEVVDLSDGPKPKGTLTIDEVEVVDPGLAEEFAVIRVVDDIDDMTFGAGNLYTFKVGQKYKVPAALADHLEEKGYLYSR